MRSRHSWVRLEPFTRGTFEMQAGLLLQCNTEFGVLTEMNAWDMLRTVGQRLQNRMTVEYFGALFSLGREPINPSAYVGLCRGICLRKRLCMSLLVCTIEKHKTR